MCAAKPWAALPGLRCEPSLLFDAATGKLPPCSLRVKVACAHTCPYPSLPPSTSHFPPLLPELLVLAGPLHICCRASVSLPASLQSATPWHEPSSVWASSSAFSFALTPAPLMHILTDLRTSVLATPCHKGHGVALAKALATRISPKAPSWRLSAARIPGSEHRDELSHGEAVSRYLAPVADLPSVRVA